MTNIQEQTYPNPGKIEKTCSVCGKTFYCLTRKAKYCSDSCKNIAYRKRHYLNKYQNAERTELENAEHKIRNHNEQIFYLKRELKTALEEIENQKEFKKALENALSGAVRDLNYLENKLIECYGHKTTD